MKTLLLCLVTQVLNSLLPVPACGEVISCPPPPAPCPPIYSLTSYLSPLTSKKIAPCPQIYSPAPCPLPPAPKTYTFVQLNCENLFDCDHDTLKNDYEYLPDSKKKWDRPRYWRKVNNIAREIIACGETQRQGQEKNDSMSRAGEWTLPDMVALCEVENDSVLVALTRRSLLRQARYDYVMTQSADERGIDVALLYSPFSFRLLRHYPLRVQPVEGLHATRDVLYAAGIIATGDTLHVMVAHAPSRRGARRLSDEYRMRVSQRIMATVDSIRALSPSAPLIVAGDFNAYGQEPSLQILTDGLLTDISLEAKGQNGARGTYKYMGEWGSLDHLFVGGALRYQVLECRIGDFPFLLEDDKKYGGVKPRRTYIGPRYQNGFSDHLPLIATFRW